jgi:hypothetical protein
VGEVLTSEVQDGSSSDDSEDVSSSGQVPAQRDAENAVERRDLPTHKSTDRRKPRASRIWKAVLSLAPSAVIGTAANVWGFAGSTANGGVRALWITACVMAIVLPVYIAWKAYWTADRWAVIFFSASLVIAGICCWQLGGTLSDPRRGAPSALDVAGKLCSLVKRYDQDPESLVVCASLQLTDGDKIDLDASPSEAINPESGSDVALEHGVVKVVAPNTMMKKISGSVVNNGAYGLSYKSCAVDKNDSTKPISVADIDAQQAICVKTDQGRLAILQVAYYKGSHEPAIFATMSWKNPGA